MKLLARYTAQLQALQAQGLQRRLRQVDSPCAPQVTVDGRQILAFASNDYLGLANHPQIIAALQRGAAEYGVGSGASHLISGHSTAHAQLELALAEFLAPHLPNPRALYFGSGYLANLAILSSLTAAFPVGASEIFSADLNHASIIDGCRLARAPLKVYPHDDLTSLAKLLAESRAEQKIVVTDSVFSMDGTLAPIPQLLALCQQYDAWLVLDDAHGFGCLGADGRGALQHFDLRSPHLIYMGTLGKAAGVGGAFVAADAELVEWMLQRGRSYIYTTASSPALAHALLTSLALIAGEEGRQRRAHLTHLIQYWQQNASFQRWQKLASDVAIQPVILGDNQSTLDAAQSLYAQGLWVPAIRPPTVPIGTARLRISLSAAHSQQEMIRLIQALQDTEHLLLSQGQAA